MAPSRPPRSDAVRLAARAGHLAAIGAVFAGGWFAMRTNDWRQIALYTGLAVLGGVLAAAFSRIARG
jgi:hypothetical protein